MSVRAKSNFIQARNADDSLTQLDDRKPPRLAEVVHPKPQFSLDYRNSNFLSRLFFHFVNPMINASHSKHQGKLTQEILIDLKLHENETEETTEYFKSCIDLQGKRWAAKNPTRDVSEAPWSRFLWKAAFYTFWKELVLGSFVALYTEGITVSYTFSLVYLIAYLRDPDAPVSQGIMLTCLYSAAVVSSAFGRNNYYCKGYVMAIKLRKTIISALYDKVARLSTKSMTETNSGKLITIISGDIFNVERPLQLLPILLAVPWVLLLSLFYVAWGSGSVLFALYTLVIWILTIVGQLWANRLSIRYKHRDAILSDHRMKLINDLVTGIRTIKCYAWENHYFRKIKELRATQHVNILKFNFFGSLGFSVFQNMGFAVVLLIFLPMWAQGQEIRAELAFSILAMIFFLFYSITSMTLFTLQNMSQLIVMFKRLGDVFRMEEYKKHRDENVTADDVLLRIQNGAFSWGYRVPQNIEKSQQVQLKLEAVDDPVISNVDIELKSGNLLMVCGKIGSGKTTLLYSIMEENRRINGDMTVRGSIAYVEQEPFIFSGTVEENITFGLVYDEPRFVKAIKASCLDSDMQQLANGQKTVIGDRGINVSGGQKARISLARAIYQDADIYLLDDPLSAVDPEVANKIFQNAICGALKHKCVVLVTHQLQFMRKCPKIMILQDGKQLMIGTNDELKERGFDADDILQNYTQSLDNKTVKSDVPKAQNIELKEQALVRLKQLNEEFKRSTQPTAENETPNKKQTTVTDLIVPEQAIAGTVGAKDYYNLFKFGPGIPGCITVVLICLATSLIQLSTSFTLTNWTSQSVEEQQKTHYPMMFVISVALFFLFSLLRALSCFWLINTSSTNMHNAACKAVLRAKILFFDSNPIGRIVTRFSKDIMVIDFMLAVFMIVIAQGILRSVTVMITVAIINPWLFIVAVVSLLAMILVMRRVVAPMQSSQVLDGIYRGPIHTTFSLVVQGLVTLRAFDKVAYFKQSFTNSLEQCANATMSFNVLSRYTAFNLDLICCFMSVATTAVCMAQKGKVDSNLLALSLQIVSDVIVNFSVSLRFYAEFDNFMTSSQRLYQYTELEPEDALEKSIDKELAQLEWPKKGEIEFDRVVMRYREGLEPTIKDLSFKVQAGMKIGIVGRTGSGKSSILQALFRLVELSSGTMKIDGQDLTFMGLHAIRKNVAYIPQTPFLLQGTIRENLDPFNELSDEEINKIVVDIGLSKKISSLKDGMNTYCSESNSLFSAGEKQLVCMARAVVRRTKILVLDEATANVDLETDNLIQTKLGELFSDCTVLIIAHRLATIIDVDRILVMSNGKAQEFDHPYRLLTKEVGDDTITNQSGLFAQSLMATGVETAQQLFEIAKQQYPTSERKFKRE